MSKVGYKYQVGEIVNESLEIVSQTRSANGKNKTQKAYEVRSTIYKDAPTYIVTETKLKRGDGCAYRRGLRVYDGNSLYSIKKYRPYLVDIEQAKKVSPKSGKKIIFKCPECGKHIASSPHAITDRGLSCPTCSKGTSYPELFMLAYFEVKNINFVYQKTYKDLEHRKFDFYAEGFGIIETHGLQHYQESSMFSYSNTAKFDREKLYYCECNNIPYIELDSRVSTFKHMRDSIRESILPNVEEWEIDTMTELIELNTRYPSKEIVELYESGKSSTYISDKTGIHDQVIINILRKHNVHIRDARFKSRPIKCSTTGKTFNSAKEASELYNVQSSNISLVCKGKRNYAGTYKGEKLQWEYIE